MTESQPAAGVASVDGTVAPELAAPKRFPLRIPSPRALGRPWRRRSALVVGTGPLATAVRLKLRLENGRHLQLDQPVRRAMVHACAQLEASLREPGIGRVVLADPTLDRQTIYALARVCEMRQVDCAFAVPGARREARYAHRSVAQRAAKRAVDIILALTLLVLLSPLMLAIGLALLLTSGRPVLIRQPRVGLHGRQFDFFKLCTLHPGAQARADKTIEALAAGRITIEEAAALLKDSCTAGASRFGLWLRRTSLDEVPQLWNVVRGEMSLVGPRPLRPFEVATLDRWQIQRHRMPPGLTGLWQVSGRSGVEWNVRMWLDHLYVREWSFLLDLKLLVRTPLAVLRGRGAQ